MDITNDVEKIYDRLDAIGILLCGKIKEDGREIIYKEIIGILKEISKLKENTKILVNLCLKLSGNFYE